MRNSCSISAIVRVGHIRVIRVPFVGTRKKRMHSNADLRGYVPVINPADDLRTTKLHRVGGAGIYLKKGGKWCEC